MDTQKKVKILLLIFAGGLLISLTYIAYLFKTDGQMVFPKLAIGKFIQKPHFVSEGDAQKIAWTIPEKCDYNSYEVREEGYVPNAGMLWGGGDASCMQTDAGFQCHAELHPQMKGEGRHWLVQAYGYGCANKNVYVSKPTMVTF